MEVGVEDQTNKRRAGREGRCRSPVVAIVVDPQRVTRTANASLDSTWEDSTVGGREPGRWAGPYLYYSTLCDKPWCVVPYT